MLIIHAEIDTTFLHVPLCQQRQQDGKYWLKRFWLNNLFNFRRIFVAWIRVAPVQQDQHREREHQHADRGHLPRPAHLYRAAVVRGVRLAQAQDGVWLPVVRGRGALQRWSWQVRGYGIYQVLLSSSGPGLVRVSIQNSMSYVLFQRGVGGAIWNIFKFLPVTRVPGYQVPLSRKKQFLCLKRPPTPLYNFFTKPDVLCIVSYLCPRQ